MLIVYVNEERKKTFNPSPNALNDVTQPPDGNTTIKRKKRKVIV